MARAFLLGLVVAVQSAVIVCDLHCETKHPEPLTQHSHSAPHSAPDSVPHSVPPMQEHPAVCENQLSASVRFSIEPQREFVSVVHLFDSREIDLDAGSDGSEIAKLPHPPFAFASPPTVLPTLRI